MMHDIEQKRKINVTQHFLPPREEYQAYLDLIWHSQRITNHGPLLEQLQRKLSAFLGVRNINIVSSGTMALQLAIKALGLKGEVITTPFSHVSTVSSLVWEGIKPRFADIDPFTLNINTHHIEALLTPHTSGILVPHIFGNPCHVEHIAEIAQKHQLKILYDCAHTFNMTINDKPITDYGDASIFSFHTTKSFHTIEGGAVISNDEDVFQRSKLMSQFGAGDDGCIREIGINGKLDEFRAAMGLCVLAYVNEHTHQRRMIVEKYRSYFEHNHCISLVSFPSNNVTLNYAYFPILLNNEASLLKVKQALEANAIYPRRYFQPVLSTLPYVEEDDCPVAFDISSRVLCLPLYAGLSEQDVDRIAEIVLYAATH